MYRGFVIKKRTIDFLKDVSNSVDEERRSIQKQLNTASSQIRSEILEINGRFNADRLMDVCMPTDIQFDIFISHSHKDVEYADKLSNYILYKFGLRCFIDSNYWLNAETEIQRPFDRNVKHSSSLQYNDVLSSTAHVHAMLSMSLLKMMNSCECCIFIDPQEPYIPAGSVTSPWIYEEITMFNYINKHIERGVRITESVSQT